MIRDITIGKYYVSDSLIHRLDPRVKLSGVLLLVISLFFVKNPLFFVPAFIVVFMLYRLATVPLGYMIKGLRAFVVLLLFTFIFRSFFTEGTVILHVGKNLTMTQEGVQKSIQLMSRIIIMVMTASLLTYTATANELAAGMEKGLSFLEKVKIPVHEMAMMISIALRFIPIMIEETNVIMDAQASRGVDFTEGNVFSRMGKVFPIVIPMFMGAFRRSADLAMAMESRGYRDARHRSRLKPLEYTKTDRKAYVLLVVYFMVFVALQIVFR